MHTFLILAGLLTIALAGSAFVYNLNPRVIPNQGPYYGRLGARWWQWAFSFPLASVPFMNSGGAVDLSAGQSGNVWFLAGQASVGPVERWGEVPAGVSLFFPLINLFNDYPCPARHGFEPDPGETLEHFLLRTGNYFLDVGMAPEPERLFAEIDGLSLTNLTAYRAASSLFTFTAGTELQVLDPCITGTPQSAIAIGYWLWLHPLPPGAHTLHFGYKPDQDVTYHLTVTP